jgi:type I restriction enzyme S subunit
MKPGYKQTEIGVIPEEWEVKPLGEMFRLLNGYAFKPEDWKQSGTPIIRIQNLNDPFAPFNFSQAPVSEKNRIETGSLLFAWSGTIGSSFGARVWTGPTGVLNQHIFKVLMDQQRITLPFSLLVFARVEDDIAKQAHGFKASFVHVKKSDLDKVKLPVPPLPEQRAIAGALSDVDALLGAQEALLAKKRDLKAAAMQQLLTGETRLPGFTGEWEVKRLGEVAEMGSGGTPPSSVSNYYDGDIPWASISDMTKGGKIIWSTDRNLSRAGFRNSAAKMFPAGTILYAMYASLGECSIAGISLCSSQAILGIRPKNELSGDFLYYFLTSLKGTVKTQGQQGTQANLNKGMVQDFRLSLPPFAEQTAIAAVLSDMDAEIVALEAQRDKTRALKQGMMQELLTGRIRLV